MIDQPKNIVLDATGQAPGRLASRIAELLMGKKTIGVRKHQLYSVRITVRHCAKMAVNQRKLAQKKYYRTSGHPGGLRYTTADEIFAKNPCDVLHRAVYGMLPGNALRKRRMQQLILER